MSEGLVRRATACPLSGSFGCETHRESRRTSNRRRPAWLIPRTESGAASESINRTPPPHLSRQYKRWCPGLPPARQDNREPAAGGMVATGARSEQSDGEEWSGARTGGVCAGESRGRVPGGQHRADPNASSPRGTSPAGGHPRPRMRLGFAQNRSRENRAGSESPEFQVRRAPAGGPADHSGVKLALTL